ncbi:ImmA/IrrE family metallo-endopeptidase [Streptomyces sp. NPDC047968]|uniref:ImmA/IrrE family metallo-endopeptidase n=1 Tax=unclassified Streptomyces TaxID=2593676 RepID=UPI003447E0DD
MNWAVAHRIAGIAAVQAHRDLGIDRSRYVPVHRALKSAPLVGMAQPMPRLFGVYFSPADNGPAVLLNATLNTVTQRHTAAHELGHHRLHHRTAADEELNPALRWGDGSWPDEEKTAEAFAAWFLMPRPAVLAGLDRICQGPPAVPEHVYQLARELGTSYAGTVRHLSNLRLLDGGHARDWARIAPAALRSSLTHGADVPTEAHVHVITARSHQQDVHADVGDLVVLNEADGSFTSLPRGLSVWDEVPRPLSAAVVTPELEVPTVLEIAGASRRDWKVTVHRDSPRLGLDQSWPD